MIDPRSRRALSVLVVAIFAVLGTATAGGGDQSAAGGASSGAQIAGMESHFATGQVWGEGPEAADMAQVLMAELEPGDTVAVRDIPGTPRRVVVLVKYGDAAAEGLSDLDDATRRQHLDALLSILDNTFELGASNVGLGIRGTLFYGAIVTRQPAQVAQYQLGVIVGTENLEAVLAAPATPATPPQVITLGQTITGQCLAPPLPTARYLLTLPAPTNVVIGMVSPGFTGEQLPFPVVCRGDSQIRNCHDETTIVTPGIDDTGNVVFELPAGTYTLFVICDDCETTLPCPPLTAPYQVTLSAM